MGRALRLGICKAALVGGFGVVAHANVTVIPAQSLAKTCDTGSAIESVEAMHGCRVSLENILQASTRWGQSGTSVTVETIKGSVQDLGFSESELDKCLSFRADSGLKSDRRFVASNIADLFGGDFKNLVRITIYDDVLMKTSLQETSHDLITIVNWKALENSLLRNGWHFINMNSIKLQTEFPGNAPIQERPQSAYYYNAFLGVEMTISFRYIGLSEQDKSGVKIVSIVFFVLDQN